MIKNLLTIGLAISIAISGYIWVPSAHKHFLYGKVGKNVVMLLSPEGGGGTGFALNWKDKNYVVSNSHVCGDGENKYMWGKQGFGFTRYRLKILAYDIKKDLCLLSGIPHLKGLTLNGEKMENMTDIHVFGHPHLNPLTYSSGKIQYVEDIDVMTEDMSKEQCDELGGKMVDRFLYQGCKIFRESYASDVDIQPGNSGSPVVDQWGQVRAVVYARGPSAGYFIPGWTLAAMLESYNK